MTHLVNGFGDLRDDNDPNLTYEGDNNLILQQTANYLLSWQPGFYSPLGSVDMLNHQNKIVGRVFNARAGHASLTGVCVCMCGSRDVSPKVTN